MFNKNETFNENDIIFDNSGDYSGDSGDYSGDSGDYSGDYSGDSGDYSEILNKDNYYGLIIIGILLAVGFIVGISFVIVNRISSRLIYRRHNQNNIPMITGTNTVVNTTNTTKENQITLRSFTNQTSYV